MADSKRQKIVNAIMARMALITTANGYETNIGTNVHEWATHFQDEEMGDAGALSVCDLIAEAQPTAEADPKYTIWSLAVQIRLFYKRGTTPANIREGLKDVNRAIRQDARWKVAVSDKSVGLAMNTFPTREGFIIPDDSFEIAGGVLEFEVQFKTDKFNSEE